MMFSGRPMRDFTNVQPTFWFRDEASGNTLECETSYDPATSSYRIFNLPYSQVGISVTFHLTGDKRTLPGNFDLWHTVDLREVDEASRKEYVLQLEKIMRLVAPVDSATALHDPAPAYPSYGSPLSLQWEAMDEATIYQVTIKECRDPGNAAYVAGCDRCTSVGFIQTPYPFAAVSLPPSADLTHFEFSLVAADALRRNVGKLMTTYDNGSYGWDYRFRIRQ